MMATIAGTLQGKVGTRIATSGWYLIDQSRIDQFGAATDDLQWIHVDPARAAREAPGGTTIAHGFLTLSLLSSMFVTSIHFPHVHAILNYGLNRVRFLAPVPVGSRVRGNITLVGVETRKQGLLLTSSIEIEREGGTSPVCVAELLGLVVAEE